MLRRKIIWSEIIIQSISIGAGFAAHQYSEHRWYIAATVTLALECFLHFIAFLWHYAATIEKISEWVGESAIENPIEDLHHLQEKSIPLQHLVPPPKDWPFNEQFRQINKRFVEEIRLLSEGSYSKPMEDIQDDSVMAAKNMERGAFCTAPAENLAIWKTAKGRDLKDLQYASAKRIAVANNQSYGFTRLFIFDNLGSIGWEDFKFMRENAANKVEVLVAERNSVSPLFKKFHREDRMDFGLWRENLLMEIHGPDSERVLHVSKQADDLKETAELIKTLKQKAFSYEDLLQKIKQPVNIVHWSTQPEKTLALDPPDGPHGNDVEAMLQVVSTNLKDGDRIAVYGLTQPLIDRAEVLKSKPEFSGMSIDVVDARSFAPMAARPGVTYHDKNWLEWQPKERPCAAIIADDALCNLSLIQTPLFFEQLASCLKPGGLLVFRTTAIFSPGVIPPKWHEIIRELRSFDPADKQFYQKGLDLNCLTSGAVCEAAWPTLHSEEFYDPRTQSFLLGDWNERIKSDQDISINLKNRLTFPRPLRMTSMDYQTLRGYWEGFFKASQSEMFSYSKWENDTTLALHPSSKEIARRFHDYYRIVTLRRI